jgi:hypothetical protein
LLPRFSQELAPVPLEQNLDFLFRLGGSVYMRSELFVARFADTDGQRGLTLYDEKIALCHGRSSSAWALILA